jgi:NAD(P)-dependent dehydrogenase (short-subunit alcohol dehydrogenase family)
MEIGDKVVVITGGASGIGAAMARRFAHEGAKAVIVTDIDGDGAADVASGFGGVGLALDVADEQQTRQVLADIEESFERIDLLCLNAGIATGGTLDTSNEAWQKTWEINVMAHVYATRYAIDAMLARGSGYILTTASAAGLLTNLDAAPYAVTKHAAVAFAEWISVTYGDRGIKVSCLCPQFVATPMLGAFSGQDGPLKEWVEALAISADDVADAVVEGIRSEEFLILPHPEVREYFLKKATDYDRWIAGMRKLQEQLITSPREP